MTKQLNQAEIKVRAKVCEVLFGLPLPQDTAEESAKKIKQISKDLNRVIIGYAWFSLPKTAVAQLVADEMQAMPAKFNWPQPHANNAIMGVCRELITSLPEDLSIPFTAMVL